MAISRGGRSPPLSRRRSQNGSGQVEALEAVRDGLLVCNPAKDQAQRRIVGRSALRMATPESPRDFALPDVRTLSRLVEEAVQRGGHQAAQRWID